MTLVDSCVFCQIIKGISPRTLVFENDISIVIEDIHSRAPIHLLVIPKIHVSDIMTADARLYYDIMETVRRVITDQHITNYRIVHNGGGAQMIDHLHIHIMGSVDAHRDL